MTTDTQERKKTANLGKEAEVYSEVVTVSPEMAEDWLGRSIQNQRKLKASRLESYRRDMASGHWRLTGQGLLFNRKGELIDGQHRLVACIMAGISFQTMVVRNLPENAMPAVDRGAPRNLIDYLRWQGESEAIVLASIIRLSWIWEHGHLRSFEWSFNNPTIEESIDWLAAQPDLREGVTPAIRLRRPPLKGQASVAGAFWWKAHGRFPEETEHFVERLLKGTNLSENDPVLAYQRILTRQQNATGSRGGRDQRTGLAYLIKAFNAFYEGRGVKHFVWKPGAGEEFPELPKPE